jgi:hypothetical protein
LKALFDRHFRTVHEEKPLTQTRKDQK